MTNSDYIISRLNDQTLAVLFQNGYSFTFEKGFANDVRNAFKKWRRNTYRPNKNFFDNTDAETERPSVFEWSKVIKDGKAGSYGYRTDRVAFQVWLSMQYDPKEWEGE